MSHIALLHPQCVRRGGAIQMALQTVRALQAQGHTITLYTFEHSSDCFPELQADLDIFVWNGRNKKEKIKNKKGGFFIINKSVSFPFFLLFFLSPKGFRIITLAWHLRHLDMVIANNPPMQIVAALAKVFSLRFKRKEKREKIKKEDDKKINNSSLFIFHYSLSSLTTVWWHHHVPWYLPKKMKNGGLFIAIKRFFEKNFVIPRIDQMVATSHYVSERLLEYCGRDAIVIHPVIQIQSQSPFQGGADEGSGGMQQYPGSLQSDEREDIKQYQKSGHGEYTYPANTKLQSFSYQMSREMTRAEQRLWFEVLQSGKTGYKWVKQKIIGNFIVDFYCHEKRLVIEVDGGVHQVQEDYDLERTRYLENLGIQVIRYTNEIVLNQIDQVREKVQWEMEKAPVPDTIPLSSTKISSPLKGALAAGSIPVPLSRGEEIQHEQGGMQSENTPVLPMVGHPLERGTGSSSADTVTLFTHGRLEEGKGLDMLTRAFDSMKNEEGRMNNAGNTQLIIFGTGSLESKLQKEGRDVRPFDGEKTFSELSTGKYGHVVGVYCSSIDAFGMASLESQMAGFPTIIMDRGGASEAILSDEYDEPVGYLVDSEEALSAIISHYVQYKTFQKPLSNVNFSHKRDYFSTTRLASDLLSLMSKTRQ